MSARPRPNRRLPHVTAAPRGALGRVCPPRRPKAVNVKNGGRAFQKRVLLEGKQLEGTKTAAGARTPDRLTCTLLAMPSVGRFITAYVFFLYCLHFLHHHLSPLNQQKEIKHWLLHPFLSSQDLQCHLQNGGVHLPSHWHGRRVPLLLIKLRASRLVPAWLN